MKKRILALALCMMLLVSVALAQDNAPYEPGALTRSLFGSAFDAGKVITADLTMALDANPAAFGLDGEQAELLRNVLDVVSNAHLRVGVGKLDEGFRLTLGAALDAQDGNAVSVSGAANVTWDGLSLESSLIPGERVTAKWETLLALAGADEDTIAIFSALRDVDWAVELENMAQEFAASAQAFAGAFDPYLQIITEYMNSLPCDVETDVPAKDGYPAVTVQMTVTLTQQNYAELFTLLVDYLEQDEVLLPALEAALANSDGDETVEDVIAALRSGIEELGNENFTVTLVLGSGEPFPFFAVAEIAYPDAEDGMNDYISLILDPDATGNNWKVTFELYDMNDNGDINDAFSLTADVVVDPDDPILEAATQVLLNMSLITDGEQVYALDYNVSSVGTTADGDLPGMQMDLSQTQSMVTEDGVVRTVANSAMLQALTAEGGESMTLFGSIDAYMGSDQAFSMPFFALANLYPDGNGGVEGVESISYQIPALGVDDISFAVAFTSEDYDLAATEALSEIALEKVSEDDLSALVGRLSTNGMQTFFAVLSVLPENLMTMLLTTMQ